MGLLNLLTAFQKKHLVEFLPYHECDTQSRQAPDLECLIKLQAQHTQQRHLIFLTGNVLLIINLCVGWGPERGRRHSLSEWLFITCPDVFV